EEARHILFFTNWVAYRRLHLPFHRKARFLVRRGLGISLQALGRVKTALQLRDADEGDDFTMQVPDSIGEVTLRTLADTCLRENARRPASAAGRLPRPRLAPRLVRQASRLAPRPKPAP